MLLLTVATLNNIPRLLFQKTEKVSVKTSRFNKKSHDEMISSELVFLISGSVIYNLLLLTKS